MTLLRDFSFCFCCCSSTPFYCLRHTHTQKPFSRLAATVAPASVRHMISNIRRHTRETSALCAPAFHHTSSSNSNREKCHKHEKQKTYIYCARNTQQLPKIQSTSHSYIIYMVCSYGITSKIIIGSGSSVFLYTRTGTNMKMPWIEYTKKKKIMEKVYRLSMPRVWYMRCYKNRRHSSIAQCADAHCITPMESNRHIEHNKRTKKKWNIKKW